MSAVPPLYQVPAPPQKSKGIWFLMGAGLIVLLALAWTCGRSGYHDYRLTRAAVERFHQQLNRGEYQEIYSETTEEFRQANTREHDLQFFEMIHRKMGDAGNFGFRSFNVNVSPRGSFVTEAFKTRFALGEGQEFFVWRIDGGVPKLYRYNVQSSNLQ